jgi:RNA polymerase sigma factor, sigma-70 family
MAENTNVMVVNNNAKLPLVIEENSLFAYFEKIKKFPVLTESEEHGLITDFKQNGNLAAAQKLITSHLRLAAKIALTYRRHGLPLADIVSEANIGLMQAVKKFDLDKKVRLSTYAIWWIKAAINDYILRSWSLVKIGTVAAQKKLFYNLSRIKARLGLYENKALEPAVVKKIADELVVDEQDVVEMNQRIGGDKSLNVMAGDDGTQEQIDFLVDNRQNIEARLANKEEAARKQKILQNCLAKLNERERLIIKSRMLTDEPVTLEELGAKLGISRERVRQIEKKAFEHLSSLVKLALQA